MSVSDALRASRFGKLKYDSKWIESGKIDDLVATCSRFEGVLRISAKDEQIITSSPRSVTASPGGSVGLGGGDSDLQGSIKSGENSASSRVAETPSSVTSTGRTESCSSVEDKRVAALSEFELAELRYESNLEHERQEIINNRMEILRAQWKEYEKKLEMPPTPSSTTVETPTSAEFSETFQHPSEPPSIFLAEEGAVESVAQAPIPVIEEEPEEPVGSTVDQEKERSISLSPVSTPSIRVEEIFVAERSSVEEVQEAVQFQEDNVRKVIEPIQPSVVEKKQGIVKEPLPATLPKFSFHVPSPLSPQTSTPISPDSTSQRIPTTAAPPIAPATVIPPTTPPTVISPTAPTVVRPPMTPSTVRPPVKPIESPRQRIEQHPAQGDAESAQLPIARSDVDRFTSAARLNEYKRLVADHQRQQEDYKNFQARMASGFCSKTANRETKGTRQDLTVFITTTINVITKANVHENLTRLGQLLHGITVQYREKRLSIKNHSDAKEFCCELIARTLVKQAENVVSGQPDMAFTLASIAVSLWVSFPRVGDFLKAIVMSNCLGLVPYYVPRAESDTDMEYCLKLGYHKDSRGELEKQTLFLKRIGGISRFWAAIMCAPAVPWHRYPKGVNDIVRPEVEHPLDFNFGWTFLVNIVQLAPRTDITAAILFEFLEVSAHFLKRAYGRQFDKLLRFIHRQSLPELLAVSSGGVGSRLKTYLESGPKRYNLTSDYPKNWRR